MIGVALSKAAKDGHDVAELVEAGSGQQVACDPHFFGFRSRRNFAAAGGGGVRCSVDHTQAPPHELGAVGVQQQSLSALGVWKIERCGLEERVFGRKAGVARQSAFEFAAGADVGEKAEEGVVLGGSWVRWHEASEKGNLVIGSRLDAAITLASAAMLQTRSTGGLVAPTLAAIDAVEGCGLVN